MTSYLTRVAQAKVSLFQRFCEKGSGTSGIYFKKNKCDFQATHARIASLFFLNSNVCNKKIDTSRAFQFDARFYNNCGNSCALIG